MLTSYNCHTKSQSVNFWDWLFFTMLNSLEFNAKYSIVWLYQSLLTIHPLMDTWIVPVFCYCVVYRFSCECNFSFFWNKCPRVWLLGHMIRVRNFQIVFQVAIPLLFSHQHVWEVKLFCIFASNYCVTIFHFKYFNSWILISPCDFNLHCLMVNAVGHLSIYLFVNHSTSSVKCLYIFCPFSDWIIISLSFENSLYTLDIRKLSDVWFARCFSQSVIFLFNCLKGLSQHNNFKFRRSPSLSMFSFMDRAFSNTSKDFSHRFRSWRFSPRHSWKNFKVLHLNHDTFLINFYMYEVFSQGSFFCPWMSKCSNTICFKDYSFSSEISFAFHMIFLVSLISNNSCSLTSSSQTPRKFSNGSGRQFRLAPAHYWFKVWCTVLFRGKKRDN